MKGRVIVGLLIAALILSAATANAQQPTFAQVGGGSVNQPNCSGAPNFGSAMWCFDSSLSTTTHNVYYWNGSAWTLVASGGAAGEQYITIGWDGDLGTLTNAAVKSFLVPCTGSFKSLTCNTTLAGTCTTPPTINVDNITTTTTGTAVTPTGSALSTANQAETVAVTAGNSVGLAQTASPGTCTVPRFACQATIQCP